MTTTNLTDSSAGESQEQEAAEANPLDNVEATTENTGTEEETSSEKNESSEEAAKLANPDSEDKLLGGKYKTVEELEDAYKSSGSAYTALQKEKVDAERKLKVLEANALVDKNEAKIFDIRKDDPDLAEEISQEKWGMSVEERTKQAINSDELDDYEKSKLAAEEVFHEREARKDAQNEKNAVEKIENEFLPSQGIQPGSQEYKDIMIEYNGIVKYASNASPELAQKAMELAYRSQTGQQANKMVDAQAQAASNPMGNDKSKNVSGITAEDIETAAVAGLTPERYKEMRNKIDGHLWSKS